MNYERREEPSVLAGWVCCVVGEHNRGAGLESPAGVCSEAFRSSARPCAGWSRLPGSYSNAGDAGGAGRREWAARTPPSKQASRRPPPAWKIRREEQGGACKAPRGRGPGPIRLGRPLTGLRLCVFLLLLLFLPCSVRQASGAAMASAASSLPAVLPPFQFRPRHDTPDWRRLSAVDVERVAAEVDVAVLQEHLGHVTFCSAERERCPHCQAPADALLLKLLRLAQLCLEYLLHSQDYLSAQLRAGQELLRASHANRDQLAKEVARGAQEIRLLKVECKRRKKMLGTQQMMLQAGATCHQCQFCDKAFMNYSFLHSHLQRRHAEESYIDQKGKAQTDKLQEEINKLKEQLQLTSSQLEAEQQAHIVKLSKEYEKHRSKEEEIRQLFHKWKEEEKEKLASELEKVKEMFMKEFKELTAKNTELENHLLEVQKSNKHLKSNLGTLKDSYEFPEEKPQDTIDHQYIMELLERQETKWTAKVQALQQEHENEKHQLTLQIEKLKTSVTEELNTSSIFYKKRMEELGQKLQEQNDLIITQKHQIQKLATKSVESIRSPDVKNSAHNIVQPKASLSSMCEHMLEPIEELPEDEKETEKVEPKVGNSKHHIIDTLKNNPSLSRELRAILEQTLAEKLESLGVKSTWKNRSAPTSCSTP